ncbi:MAG TPA: PAS domain-containing protein [Stellaceae bacterium]|nr:PAS domain-containing protein [Stellaceae bacterium]
MTHTATAIAIEHPRLQQLYDYWLSKLGERTMPSRADLDPIDMRFVIGNVIMVDVIEGTQPQFRIRLHGTNLAEQVHFDLTGKLLDEMPLPEFRELTRLSFSKVVTTKEPLHARRDRILDSRRRAYETLILPLSSDGERVDRILCGLFYDHVDR